MDKESKTVDKVDKLKQEIDEGFMEETSFEFADLVARHLSNPVEMLKFTRKVMENAEEGDSTSLKMIQQALADVKYQKDKKQILTNEQLRRIIKLTAERDGG